MSIAVALVEGLRSGLPHNPFMQERARRAEESNI